MITDSGLRNLNLEFSAEAFPLCVVTSTGRWGEDDVWALLTWQRRLSLQAQRFALLYDLRDGDGIDKAGLRLLERSAEEVHAIQHAWVICVGYVAESVVMRMALRSAMMVVPDVVPSQIFRHVDACRRWLDVGIEDDVPTL